MGKKRVIEKSESSSAEKTETKNIREVKSGNKIQKGIASIQASYNNTIITITDSKGNTLAWSSAGSLGFTGAKKATPYAAARIAETVVEKIKKTGMQEIDVKVSGVGSGRDSAVRALANHGLTILSIHDVTPLPHNGPKSKNPRRV